MALSPCNSTTDLHQKELIEHGSIAFPIACYDDDLSLQNVPWHWHEEFEYAIAYEGTPEFLIENTRIRLNTGECIFINSEVLHAVEAVQPSGGRLHSAVFHARLIGSSMDSIFWQKLILPMLKHVSLRYIILKPEIPWQNAVLQSLNTTWESIAHETDDFENLTRYELSKAFRLLNEHCHTIDELPSEQERLNATRIRSMLAFIDAHYTEELTIEQIADSISVSGSVCLRCFNRTLGISPIQYVKQLRLDKAAELLRTTSKTAKEIAYECGFNDVSYFTKAFREKYACTPKEYQTSKSPFGHSSTRRP